MHFSALQVNIIVIYQHPGLNLKRVYAILSKLLPV